MLPGMTKFLVDAKRGTYAATGDDESVAPALPDSKQLEYRSGEFSDRDIYFGMDFLVGQETVSHKEKVIWSMVYAGGVAPPIKERTRGSGNLCFPAPGTADGRGGAAVPGTANLRGRWVQLLGPERRRCDGVSWQRADREGWPVGL
jgi:hypothetical protein